MEVPCWEYICGVQLNRPREPTEVSIDTRQIIQSHTPPEEWMCARGAEGWEVVAIVNRGEYTEFFMKRRVARASQRATVYLSAGALQRDFGETTGGWVAGTRWISAIVKDVAPSGVLVQLVEPVHIGRVVFDEGQLFLPWKMIGLLNVSAENRPGAQLSKLRILAVRSREKIRVELIY